MLLSRQQKDWWAQFSGSYGIGTSCPISKTTSLSQEMKPTTVAVATLKKVKIAALYRMRRFSRDA
jgi:hypothetical protein